jgi:hypothetical protein
VGVQPLTACHLPLWLCHWATAQFAPQNHVPEEIDTNQVGN